MQAEILDTGNPKIAGARIVINKSASELFNFIANPKNHPKIDGSKMVRGKAYGPKRLSMNSWFVMRQLRFGKIPYLMPNKVVEFEEGKLIAWRNALPSRWRYEFVAQSDGTTQVTQYLDCTQTPSKLVKSELSWAPKALQRFSIKH